MQKRIIYTNENGGLSIITPAPNARGQVMVSADVYKTVTIPATEESESREIQELVSPAVYRPQTDDEFAMAVALRVVPPIIRYEGTGVVERDGEGIEHEVTRQIVEPRAYKIVDASDIPSDSTFRDAWEMAEDDGIITINIDKAKQIAHDMRRRSRAAEFEPLDAIIAKQIPGVSAQEAEAARQSIREKYAAMEAAIDAAQTPEAVKAALSMGA